MQSRKIVVDLIIQALLQGGGIYRNGHYDLSPEHVDKGINHLLETGHDIFPELDKIIHGSWPKTSHSIFEDFELEFFDKFFANKLLWKPEDFTSNILVNIKNNIELSVKQIAYERSYMQRRKQSIINNKKVFSQVLEKSKGECKKCKTTDSLTVDHIIPILHGGTDDLNNLQALCRSCNSKKGAKCNGK